MLDNFSNSKAAAAALAEDINDLAAKLAAARKSTIEHAISIGKKLREAKQIVPYGKFGGWCKHNVQIEKSCRADYMKLAKAKQTGELDQVLNGIPIGDYDGGIKDLVARLSPSKVAPKRKSSDLFKAANSTLSRARKELKRANSNIEMIHSLSKHAENSVLDKLLTTHVKKEMKEKVRFIQLFDKLLGQAELATQSSKKKKKKKT